MKPAAPSLEATIARLLTVGTYASIGLVGVGTVLLLAAGRSPLDPAPDLDLGRLVPDLLSGQPAGFIWLGILGIIATPAARVLTALVGYRRSGERTMVLVAAAILVVIAAGVVTGTATG